MTPGDTLEKITIGAALQNITWQTQVVEKQSALGEDSISKQFTHTHIPITISSDT